MNAVAQKKLCWNCEGNVARDIDNCPYCGVYVHAAMEEEAESIWNPSYIPSSKTEEIPSPIYQIAHEDDENDVNTSSLNQSENSLLDWKQLLKQFKSDIFPILFLMMGSVFFLFGIVLFLFSQNGGLTLHWKEENALYFLLVAVPLIGCGWIFLQQIED